MPLKLGEDRKTRLASYLSSDARRALGDYMADHVITQLSAVDEIAQVVVITAGMARPWPVRFELDQGRGLNMELDDAATRIGGGIIVIHGDLPLVGTKDIRALIYAANDAGSAIAPDRHGTGTNALALRNLPDGFAFAFGSDSFNLHRQRLGNRLAVVERAGLACDVDTKDDLDHAVAAGFRCILPSAAETASRSHP